MREMNHVHLRQLDLNLLLVFDALMTERSVTRAGESLLLTQGAVSHGLRRLRNVLGDELFVRSKDGMNPTARALELAVPLAEVLSRLNAAFGPVTFDPASSDHTFRIASTDYFATLVLPRLVKRVEAQAPKVNLRILPHTVANVPALLDNHQAEFAVGFFQNSLRDMLPAHCESVELSRDEMVCVMRRDHLLAKGLSFEKYLAATHLLFSLTGDVSSAVDRQLAKKKRSRRIGVTISHYLAAPLILQSSDMIMTVPGRMAQLYVDKYDLIQTAAPVDLPPAPTQLVWNSRLNRHEAHAWMRSLIVDVSAQT